MEPFVSSDGREVPLRAVGRRYVQMVMDKWAIPDVPTYEAKTAGGEVEIHQHRVGFFVHDEQRLGEDFILTGVYGMSAIRVTLYTSYFP